MEYAVPDEDLHFRRVLTLPARRASAMSEFDDKLTD
jgi:hypothetical protein